MSNLPSLLHLSMIETYSHKLLGRQEVDLDRATCDYRMRSVRIQYADGSSTPTGVEAREFIRRDGLLYWTEWEVPVDEVAWDARAATEDEGSMEDLPAPGPDAQWEQEVALRAVFFGQIAAPPTLLALTPVTAEDVCRLPDNFMRATKDLVPVAPEERVEGISSEETVFQGRYDINEVEELQNQAVDGAAGTLGPESQKAAADPRFRLDVKTYQRIVDRIHPQVVLDADGAVVKFGGVTHSNTQRGGMPAEPFVAIVRVAPIPALTLPDTPMATPVELPTLR